MFFDFLNLSGSVGDNQNNDPGDIRATSNSLLDLMDKPPAFGIANEGNPPVNAIKDFQDKNDLARDGVLEPGGPTQGAINRKLLDKSGGLLGDLDPVIKGDVGAKARPGGNLTGDLDKTENGLNALGFPIGPRPGSGVAAKSNESRAITVADGLIRFQKSKGLKPDGLMKPGGPTQNALGQGLATIFGLAGALAKSTAAKTAKPAAP